MSNFDQSTEADNRWLKLVQAQVNSLRFGVVQIVVHDSRVIQIERTEKYRLDRPRNEGNKDERATAAAVAWLE